MKDIFWADTALLESVGEHEKHIDQLREDMSRAIKQAMIPLIAYARANEQFLELINTDINAYIKSVFRIFFGFIVIERAWGQGDQLVGRCDLAFV